jgi:transposase
MIQSIRPKRSQLVTRFEVFREFSQHDFGEVDVRFLSGARKRVHFFGSRLKYSRWTAVSVVPNEQVEVLVRAMVEHFDGIGGIPLLAVFDRPKTIVLHWGRDGQVTEWNPTFAGVAPTWLGIELLAAQSRAEGLRREPGEMVKGSFLSSGVSDEDLHRSFASGSSR